MSDQTPRYPADSSTTTGLRFAKILVWLVYAYFILAVVILILNFFLLLFNASTTAEFTQWVYRSGNRVLEPFRGIFPTRTTDSGSVIDFAVLFAIIVYGIVAMAIHGLINWIDRLISEEKAKTLYLAAQQQGTSRAQPAAPAPAPQNPPS